MLNIENYKGQDLYSDGDIEKELLEIVRKHDDFTEILMDDNRWPVLYHLSMDRRNLLEWYPFEDNKSLLEIGAGCGALTGLFCEKTKHVTAVELSKQRSEIIEARHKSFDNLEIIVGNFTDIKFDKQFDYITLIGVLEYAGRFIDSPTPYLTFLAEIKNLLKPDGVLFIAIENQFGLKYFAGAKEDHLAREFVGIEGYSSNDCRTFGKNKITDILHQAGISELSFYYPYPDYKLPTAVFSEKYPVSCADVKNWAPAYDYPRFIMFNEQKASFELTQNNISSFFANSFLIECSIQTQQKGSN